MDTHQIVKVRKYAWERNTKFGRVVTYQDVKEGNGKKKGNVTKS